MDKVSGQECKYMCLLYCVVRFGKDKMFFVVQNLIASDFPVIGHLRTFCRLWMPVRKCEIKVNHLQIKLINAVVVV